MFFWLKKLIGYCLMPLPLSLELCFLGLFLLWRGKYARLGKCLVCTGLLWLLLCSNKSVSGLLLKPLESRYPAMPEIAASADLPDSLRLCHYVAVLGGGHEDSNELPSSSRLCESSLARLVEGVRLARIIPNSQLIVSGALNPNGKVSHGQTLRRAAIALGIPSERIVVIEKALDTHDEAKEIHAIVGTQRVAMVTSAWHMPRAVALFRKQGIKILPCPADFKGKRNESLSLSDIAWDSDSLSQSTVAVREYMGLLWTRLRGQTD